jgi:hypothetical protein
MDRLTIDTCINWEGSANVSVRVVDFMVAAVYSLLERCGLAGCGKSISVQQTSMACMSGTWDKPG